MLKKVYVVKNGILKLDPIFFFFYWILQILKNFENCVIFYIFPLYIFGLLNFIIYIFPL